MKNGKLERKDEETLKAIYNKLNVYGTLKEPLTVEEQVMIYGIAKWIGENVRDSMEDRCICCGEIIPEGRMVCKDCESNPTRKVGDTNKCDTSNYMMEFSREVVVPELDFINFINVPLTPKESNFIGQVGTDLLIKTGDVPNNNTILKEIINRAMLIQGEEHERIEKKR